MSNTIIAPCKHVHLEATGNDIICLSCGDIVAMWSRGTFIDRDSTFTTHPTPSLEIKSEWRQPLRDEGYIKGLELSADFFKNSSYSDNHTDSL